MGPIRPVAAAYEEAFRVVMAHRTLLEVAVRSVVRDPELVEDTLSDVALEIARHWDRYDPSRPFAPWARCVARRVAFDNLRRRGLRTALLDEEVLESVAAHMDSWGGEARLESRLQALRQCTEQLPPAGRELVRLRYFENRPHEEIARLTNRTANALYVAYSRLHEALLECVRKKLEWA